MPLLDENRILVKHGLECLRLRGGAGIVRLMELAKLQEKSALESEDVAFRLAPRLNAAGRLGSFITKNRIQEPSSGAPGCLGTVDGFWRSTTSLGR